MTGRRSSRKGCGAAGVVNVPAPGSGSPWPDSWRNVMEEGLNSALSRRVWQQSFQIRGMLFSSNGQSQKHQCERFRQHQHGAVTVSGVPPETSTEALRNHHRHRSSGQQHDR